MPTEQVFIAVLTFIFLFREIQHQLLINKLTDALTQLSEDLVASRDAAVRAHRRDRLSLALREHEGDEGPMPSGHRSDSEEYDIEQNRLEG